MLDVVTRDMETPPAHLSFRKKKIYIHISLQNIQFPVRIFVDCEQIVKFKRKMFSDCEVLAVNKKPLEPDV